VFSDNCFSRLTTIVFPAFPGVSEYHLP